METNLEVNKPREREAGGLKRLLNNNEVVFLGPVNAYITFWTLFPLLYMLGISLTNWKIPNPIRFIGLDNYAEALQSPLFWHAIRITISFALAVSLLEVILGFGIALLLSHRSQFSSLVRTVLIVPMVLTPVVTAMMWRYLYNPSFGPMNYILSFVRLGPYEWHSRSETV